MSLYTKRLRQQAEAEALSRGEGTDYYTDDAPLEFRQQLVFAFDNAVTWQWGIALATDTRRELAFMVQRYLCEEYGQPTLAIRMRNASDAFADVEAFIEFTETEKLMDVIDSVIRVLVVQAARNTAPGYSDQAARAARTFVATVNERLKEHRLPFEIVEGQIAPKSSEELHQEVVVPALALLRGKPRFANAERQYREALDELGKGNFADAVTDANSAAEVVLRTILGLDQGQLPDLLGQARVRGLFGEGQTKGMKKFVDGLGALASIRNTESDAHGNTTSAEFGWLAVHWAGALMVCIVNAAEARGM